MFTLLFALTILSLGHSVPTTTTAQQQNQNHCELPIVSKLYYRHQWPLAFEPDSDEFYTSAVTSAAASNSNVTLVEANAEVVLSCGPNYLKQFQRQETMLVRCNGGTGNFIALPAEVEYAITKLSCDLRVIEEVVAPVAGCPQLSTTSTFGYVTPKTQQSVLIGEACYEQAAGLTRFVHIKLGKQPFLHKEPKTYLTKNTHPETSRYKIEFFQHLNFDEIYAHLRDVLHQKHTPHFQLAQYIDETLLSTPQLSAVKKLAWNYFVANDEINTLTAVKIDIKQLSAHKPIDVYVGSHGVMTFTSSAGRKVPLYLDEERFPVPAYIWLLAQSNQHATVFVVSNTGSNSIDVEASVPPLCHSDCSRVSWLTRSANMPGLLCCSVDDAMQKIDTIPKTLQARDMLL